MWEAIVELSWRAYPAAALMALGVWWALPGTRRFVVGLRPPYREAAKTLDALRGFRRAVIGLALVGMGAAWLWQIDWVLVLAVVIGGEETLESTLHIQAVSMSKRVQERRAARAAQARPAGPTMERGSR